MPSQPWFDFHNQNADLTWIFLPGWGMDGRIFSHLQGPFNRLIIHHFRKGHYLSDIDTLLSTLPITPLSLCGYSLGGFIAVALLNQMKQSFQKVVLAGIAPSYPLERLRTIHKHLEKNHRAYMKQFYKAACHGSNAYALFKSQFQDALLERFSKDQLQDSLSLLGTLDIHTLPKHPNLHVIHGAKDIICEANQLRRISGLRNPKIIPTTGHFLLHEPDFINVIQPIT